MKQWYPVMLDLAGRACTVVGGGAVALRRVRALVEAGADVTVVSPRLADGLAELAAAGRIRAVREPYGGDVHLSGALFVVAATDDAGVNAAVRRDAARLGLLCSDAAASGGGDFMLPAVVRRGGLVLAVSTSGASPGLSARIAAELGGRYGDEYGVYIDFLAEMRAKALAVVADRARREEIFEILLNSGILDLIRAGRLEAVRAPLLDALGAQDAAGQVRRIIGRNRRGVGE